MDPSVTATLLAEELAAAGRTQCDAVAKLSVRERQILQLVGEGKLRPDDRVVMEELVLALTD